MSRFDTGRRDKPAGIGMGMSSIAFAGIDCDTDMAMLGSAVIRILLGDSRLMISF